MAQSLGQFSKRLRAKAKRLEPKQRRRIIRIMEIMHETVTLATPIITGRTANNWLIGIGRPNRRTHQVPTDPAQPTAAVAAGVARARRTLMRYKKQNIYLTNNLPWILGLNRGRARRAGKYFIERALFAGRREAKRLKLNAMT